MGNSLTRKQIEEIYNSAPAPGQTNSNSFNLSRDEIANIYNSYTPEIPKLDQNTTPTPTSDYRAEIERMNKLKADTTAPRTEGENQAIDTYLNSLTDAQRYLDSQKSVSTTTKSGAKVKKQPIGTVEIKADGTKKFTKAMSAEERKNYEDQIRRHNQLEQAKIVGKQAKQNAQPKERALSANEQRDLERAQEAIANAQKNEVKKEEKAVALPTTDQEKVENIQVGQIKKPIEANTLADKLKNTKQKIHPEEEANKTVNNESNANFALANPGDAAQTSDFKRLQNALLYDAYSHEITPESETFKKYDVPATEWDELGEDIKNWNVYRGNITNPINAVVSSNIGKKLEKKYGIDVDTLSQMANDYQYESANMKGEQLAEQARELGVEHPAAASLASLGANVGSAVLAPTQLKEDLTNYVGSGMPVSPYEGAHLLAQQKNNLREGVKDNFDTGAGQLAYDIGMGFGDFGVASIPSLVGAPVTAPAIMAMQTMNDTSTGALERGANPLQASLFAIGSAATDYLLNTVGLDKAKSMAFDRLKGAGVLKALARNAAAGGVEAGENLLQEGIQTALDEVINGENSEMRTNYAQRIANGEDPVDAIANVALDKLKQFGVSAGTGYLMGSATQGVESLTNEAFARYILNDMEKNSQKVWDRVNEYKNQLNPLEEVQESMVPETPLVQQTKKPVPGAWIPVSPEPEVPVVSQPEINPATNRINISNQAPENAINSLVNMVGGTKNAEANEIPRVENTAPEVVENKVQPVQNTPQPQPQPQPQTPAEVKQPIVNENPTGPETRERNTISTLKKAGVLKQKDIDKSPELQAVKDYTVKHNIESMANAQEDVDKNAKQLIKEYSSGKRKATTDEDADKIMIMLTDKDIKKSRAQKNAMMINLIENETESGRFIQALAKWANTSSDALVKGTKILYDTTKSWESTNKKRSDLNRRLSKALAEMGNQPVDTPEKVPLTHEQVKDSVLATLERELGSVYKQLNDVDKEYLTILSENKDIPVWQITDELEHRLKTGSWYTLDESTPGAAAERSNKLTRILDSVVNGKELEGNREKPQESRYEQMQKIRNSLNDEMLGVADKFNDDDYFFIAEMFENKVPTWQIEDELRHKLETGQWYTIDESTPVKKEKSSQLVRMLNNVVGGNQPKKEKAPETYSEFLTKIRNTIEDEPSGIASQFTDADYYFIGNMMANKIPQWQIEDELRHKLETGEWYALDESILSPKPTSQKLQNALNSLVEGEVRPQEPTRKTFQQIREEVRNTLENSEYASMVGDIDDAGMDYLANLMEQGATTKEIADALNMKAATGKWGVSEETVNKVNDLFDMARHYDENSKEFVEAQAEAFRLLAEEVAPKASPLEKFDAWRYMAMLGNPKTMLRNYMGNKLAGAMVGASNTFSAMLEAGVDKMYYAKTGKHIQRTKALLNPVKDKALIDLCKDDAYGKRYRNIEGTKYEKSTHDAILQQRNTYDSKVMQLAEKAIDRGISDTKAVVNKYGTSLAGYMKANGLDESYFNDSYKFDQLERKSRRELLSPEELAEMDNLRGKADVMEKARDYALKQAEYATFHEDNVIAEGLAKLMRDQRNSNNLVWKGMGYIGEGILPFKKTPANILRTGLEYSPFGAIKSLAETGKLIYENTGKRKGNLEDTYTVHNKITGNDMEINRSLAADVIDSWSKTLTGGALTLLGSYLYDKGALTSSYKDEKYQDQKEGIGNYALNINGHTFTLDWAAPGVMPLLVGAEFKKIADENAILNQHWYENPDKILRTVNAILDPMFETSMMSGVKDTLENAAKEVRYNEDSAIGGILGSLAGNALTGYFSQAIPTLSGQIARTVDPIRRTTDTYNEGFIGGVEKQARKTMNKIPFLSMLNTPYVDASGEYQHNSPFESTNALGILGNLAYQTLIPSYYNKQHTTEGDEKAREIYNATYIDDEGNEVPIRDAKVFSDWRSTKKINGEKLNPKELQEFRTEMGLANEDLKAALAESDWFNDLSYQDQNEIYKSLNTISDKIGQYAVRPDSVSVTSKLKTYVDAGEGEEGIQAIVDQLEAEYNPYGIDKKAYKEMKESGEDMSAYKGYSRALEKLGLKDTKDLREAWKSGGEDEFKDTAEYQQALKDIGLSDSQTNKDAWDSGGKQALGRIADYNQTFQDAGMSEVYTSKSAKQAYAKSKQDPDIMQKYARYRQWLKNNDMTDSESLWNDYLDGKAEQKAQEKQAKAEEKQAIEEQKDKWADYGLYPNDNIYDADKSYSKAHDEIPTLTEQQFANTYKKINTDSNTNVSQKEIIAYLNEIEASEEKGNQIWNAYLTNETDKTIPVLKNGTWSTKRK